MRRILPLLALVAAAAAGPPEPSAVPEGCRDGVTLLCADPSWPAATEAPGPVRTLTAKVAPAPPVE